MPGKQVWVISESNISNCADSENIRENVSKKLIHRIRLNIFRDGGGNSIFNSASFSLFDANASQGL